MGPLWSSDLDSPFLQLSASIIKGKVAPCPLKEINIVSRRGISRKPSPSRPNASLGSEQTDAQDQEHWSQTQQSVGDDSQI